MDEIKFCALDEQLAATQCKWDSPDLPYFVRDAFPGLTLDDSWAVFDWAMGQWASVCNLRPRRVGSIEASRIYAIMQRLDGPSGILADSELPCGAIVRARQRYDSSEAWNRTIQARLVVLHELGHAIGIGHIGNGNVLAPYYNANLSTLQAGDIAEAVTRYGPPVSLPPPPPPIAGILSIDTNTRVITADAGWRLVTRG